MSTKTWQGANDTAPTTDPGGVGAVEALERATAQARPPATPPLEIAELLAAIGDSLMDPRELLAPTPPVDWAGTRRLSTRLH
ncbi:MAG TPA: hypothetical protein VLT47_11055 [Anaeromyxobacteraceae bacterium]|nr:hypothetical protein [Anaeromyxobacteraceae bacterium]